MPAGSELVTPATCSSPISRSPPSATAAPRVLFMCRAWPSDDPHDSAAIARRPAKPSTRCAPPASAQARAEFGERFYGGFALDEFTRREYGDCLLPDHRASERRAFLARVRDSAVCVATTGLHGSHRLEDGRVRGGIARHSLRAAALPGARAASPPGATSSSSPRSESFITSVERLLRDDSLREDMMRANWEYYRRWVRPDAQVLRTLERVLGDAGRDGCQAGPLRRRSPGPERDPVGDDSVVCSTAVRNSRSRSACRAG